MNGAAASYVAGSYCSYRQIAALTVPAILLNAAAPATTTLQTVLLGHLSDSVREQVAAFAAVSVVASFLAFLPNFLVRVPMCSSSLLSQHAVVSQFEFSTLIIIANITQKSTICTRLQNYVLLIEAVLPYLVNLQTYRPVLVICVRAAPLESHHAAECLQRLITN